MLPIPSVPRPIVIPLALNFATSHIPEDNLQLLIGLCDIPPLIFFKISMSLSDISTAIFSVLQFMSVSNG